MEGNNRLETKLNAIVLNV